MDLTQSIAMSMGLAWASGINLYAAVMMLGVLGASGNIVLPPDLEPIAHPMVIIAAGFMYCVEFFADKIPGVDTGWDTLHTFVRIPAAAVLAAGAVGDISVPAQLAAALVGGTLATGAHLTKAGSRVLINTSPEPVTNWVASFSEDLAVFGGLWAALHYPWVFFGLLVVFILVAIWLLPKIWRGIRSLFAALGRLFGRSTSPPPLAAPLLSPRVDESPPPE